MAEIKDKVVTVESLSALHEYNENAYMQKEEYMQIEHSYIILKSSTEDSTKKFKVTVDDDGVLTATEIAEPEPEPEPEPEV